VVSNGALQIILKAALFVSLCLYLLNIIMVGDLASNLAGGKSGRMNVDVGDSRVNSAHHFAKFTCGDPLSWKRHNISCCNYSFDTSRRRRTGGLASTSA